MNSFGCILNPGFFKNKNKPKINDKYMDIMARRDFFLHNELSIYPLLQDLNYFYIFETAESITYNTLEENNTSDMSNILDESNYVLLRYPFKHIFTLEETLDSLKSTPPHYIQFIMTSYQKLLYSINKLNEQSIVHNNISYKTICIDEKMELLICKFGLSMHLNKANQTIDYINKYLLVYNPEYKYWPTEFHVLSFMLSNKIESISKVNLETIMEDIYSQNKLDFDKKEATVYFIKYINKPLSYIINDIFIYKQTWDNYSLSILFLDILSESKLCETNTFIINFKNLLLSNIRPNPLLRLTIVETLYKFEKLCFETDILIYKELLRNPL